MIIDTDVLIWFLRHNVNATTFIAAMSEREISQATWLELYKGARNKRELKEIKTTLAGLHIRTLPLTEAIGEKAIRLMEDHVLKDGLDLADALIAATALINNLPLATANFKHFKLLGLDLRVLKPW